MSFEFMRLLILCLGWPVLLVGGLVAIFKAVKFNKKLQGLPLGKIVIAVTVSQIFSMILLGIVATAFLFVDLKLALAVVGPVFILWAAAMAVIFFISSRWSQEAARINILYYKIKKRTEEVNREKEKLHHIASNMPTGVIFLDSQGKVMFINREAKNIAGFDSADNEEIYGAILGKFSSVGLKEKVEECLRGYPASLMEVELAGRIYEIHLRNLVDHTKSASDYFGHFIWIRDVSQEKLLAKAKDNFITVASHKLRTPLSGINLLLDSLLASQTLPAEDRQTLNKIKENTNLLIDLVNNIIQNIDYSTQGIAVRRQKCQLADIVKEITSHYQKSGANCQIQFKPPADLPLVKTDKNLISQVLKIIIDNAIIYNEPGCAVKIDLAQKGQQAVLSVQDNGIGIPGQAQPLVFSKFYRAENAMKKYTDGTGTSLFRAKNIIKALAGKIWFDSEEGQGTTFYVSLPLEA